MLLRKFLSIGVIMGMLLCMGCEKSSASTSLDTNKEAASSLVEAENTKTSSQGEKDGEQSGEEDKALPMEEQVSENIMVNQIGYLPKDTKEVVFRGKSVDETFKIVSIDSGATVYEGKIAGKRFSNASAEETYIGDFSQLHTEGRYKVVTPTMGTSYPFSIGEEIYKEAFEDAVRFFYYQRCGQEIPKAYGGDWSHPPCHTELATLYGTEQKIDVSGGWHDAGDYGRYVVATSKAVADLLLAYDSNPEAFGDDTNIPESGNGIADVLDEVKYQLQWLLKMQSKESGGVYHKVTCANFPGYIMPQDEIGKLIVCPETTTATGDFIAVMAMGYEHFKEIEPELANKCLAAAERAWKYLLQTPNQPVRNPKGIVTGEYADNEDIDERAWAAAQLFKATGKKEYEDQLYKLSNSFSVMDCSYGWQGVGAYALDCYLSTPEASEDLVKKCQSATMSHASNRLANAKKDGYCVDGNGWMYYWGSNMVFLSHALLFSSAYELNGDEAFMKYANEQVNYCFGKNPMGISYVTGYGSVYPEHPHHRPSIATRKTIPGMLAGGANGGREDDAVRRAAGSESPAKCYVDDQESYSTNEVDIYWNSTLVYAMAKLHRVPKV